MIKKIIILHVKHPIFCVIDETDCVDRFLKNTEVSQLMKIRQLVAELFHMGGRTET